jgi:dienelactone hydrolase
MEFEVRLFKFENEGREINGIITLPKGKENNPLVVMNHGFAGSKHEGIGFVCISEALAKNGVATARFDFSGCGESKVPFTEFSLKNNISDSNAVLSYIMETESIDKDKLGILGYSMGGRLAVLVTDADTNPYKAMVLIAPGAQDNMDFSAIGGFEYEGDTPIIEFYGNKFRLGKQLLLEGPETNAILKNVTKKIDSIIFSGTEDILVTPEACQIIASKLGSKLFTLEGANHGYSFFENQNMDYVNKIVNETVAFFAGKL